MPFNKLGVLILPTGKNAESTNENKHVIKAIN